MRFFIIATHRETGRRYSLGRSPMGAYFLHKTPNLTALKLPLFVCKNVFAGLYEQNGASPVFPCLDGKQVNRDDYDWTTEDTEPLPKGY